MTDASIQLASWQKQWLTTVAKERSHYTQLRKHFLSHPGIAVAAQGDMGLQSPAESKEGELRSQPVDSPLMTSSPSSVRKPSFAGGDSYASSSRSVSSASRPDLDVNNPLSLASSNPWNRHYANLELLSTIEADVTRTYPDVPLFSAAHEEDEANQDEARQADDAIRARAHQGLKNALFVWCCIHQDVGYRQGMHELAAACYFTRWNDRMSSPRSDQLSSEAPPAAQSQEFDDPRLAAAKDASALNFLRTMLDEKYVEHDAYTLFNSLMLGAKPWYEWKVPEQASPQPSSASPSSGNVISAAPIVRKCEDVFDLLRQIDPALASHLTELGIEPQLYALRWIRLLFTREFALQDSLEIWDGVLAFDGLLDGIDEEDTVERGSLALVDYVCVAMLLRIRAPLLAGSYSAALQHLLRYPPLPSNEANENQGQQTGLLVRQAITIRSSPSPTTGVQVVIQNRDKLGIDMVVDRSQLDDSPQQNRRATPANRGRPTAAKTVATGRTFGQRPGLGGTFGTNEQSASTSTAIAPSAASNPVAPSPFSPAAYLPDGISDIAKGIYEKSDVLGINRAVGSAMSNVQAAVSAYTAAAGRSRASADGFPPLVDDVANQRSLKTMNPSNINAAVVAARLQPARVANQDPVSAELAALKEANRAMGAAIASCIDTLEQKWKQSENDSQLSVDDISTLMSITSLKHIRDVLLGTAREYDPAILGAAATHATAPESAPKRPVPPPPSSAAPSNGADFTPAAKLPRIPIRPLASPATSVAPPQSAIRRSEDERPVNLARHAATISTSGMLTGRSSTSSEYETPPQTPTATAVPKRASARSAFEPPSITLNDPLRQPEQGGRVDTPATPRTARAPAHDPLGVM